MTVLHPQFIVNQSGEKISVVLPIEEYNLLLAESEEQDDVKQYKKAKKGPQEFIDATAAFAQIDKKRSSK